MGVLNDLGLLGEGPRGTLVLKDVLAGRDGQDVLYLFVSFISAWIPPCEIISTKQTAFVKPELTFPNTQRRIQNYLG